MSEGSKSTVAGFLANILGMIVIMAIGGCESGSWFGAGIALALAILLSLVALVGFIPFGIGPVVYILALYPFITGLVFGICPVAIPITVLILEMHTAAMSVIYTAISSLGAIALLFS